jgi:uncharacterized protein YjiK
VVVLLAGCGNRPAPGGALSRYDLAAEPDWQVVLAGALREISGLALSPDGRMFAHGDEDATVFEVEPRTGQVLKRFGLAVTGREPDLGKPLRAGQVAGDFEGLAIVGDHFFLVTSNGVLVEFVEGKDGETVPYEAHSTGLGKICEVEGLTRDTAPDGLLLLCKQQRSKADRDRVTIYAWSIQDRRLAPNPRVVIPYSALDGATRASSFNGSALELAPGGSLVLVAGPQRLFAEVAPDGRVVTGGRLDRTALPQPEGVVFLKDSTLVIGSEGGRGAATLNGYRPR